MKNPLLLLCVLLTPSAASLAETPAPAPNGITLPEGYRNWRLIAVSQRSENQTLRAILGNSVAIDAAKAGKTNPWPEGTILAKLVWKQKTHDRFATAQVPGEFVHAEFMIKDSGRYGATAGWGFARWLGLEQKPYGKDANFSAECQGCHNQVADRDSVFTVPAPLP